MERTYEAKVGTKPPADEQGSDALLRILAEYASRNHVPGNVLSKQIIAWITDPRQPKSRTSNEEHVKADGTVTRREVEVAEEATTYEQWQCQNKVFRTTLLMATIRAPATPPHPDRKEGPWTTSTTTWRARSSGNTQTTVQAYRH